MAAVASAQPSSHGSSRQPHGRRSRLTSRCQGTQARGPIQTAAASEPFQIISGSKVSACGTWPISHHLTAGRSTPRYMTSEAPGRRFADAWPDSSAAHPVCPLAIQFSIPAKRRGCRTLPRDKVGAAADVSPINGGRSCTAYAEIRAQKSL